MLNNSTPFSMPVVPANNGNNNNGLFGGDGWWAIIIFAIIFGWGGFGGFGGGYGAGGAAQNYTLASDFATIQRQLSDGFGGVEKGLDTIRNGLCDGFYTEAQLISGVNSNIAQNGYESRLAITNLGSQMQNCCCDIKTGIQANTTQGILNTNAIQQQLAQNSNDNERLILQSQFANERANCTTLQAIDKVGDRIIDYLANEKAQTLRDENFALKLAASQERQNNYLVATLGQKCPEPAYIVPNPNASCGCGCGCGFSNLG